MQLTSDDSLLLAKVWQDLRKSEEFNEFDKTLKEWPKSCRKTDARQANFNS